MSSQVSLYRGILPPLLQKSVTTALMFGTYEQYRRVLVEAGQVSVTQTQSLVIAAFGAGCTEALLTPFERVQTLMLDHRWARGWDIHKYTLDSISGGLSNSATHPMLSLVYTSMESENIIEGKYFVGEEDEIIGID